MSKNPINTISASTELVPFLLERAYERRQALFLWGKPGIGKSTLIRDWVSAKKDWDYHDVRLTTMEPSDLRGLPSIDKENQRTIWNLPEFLPSASSKKPGVIFLDELTAADPRLQASAYELINERSIGGKPIPENYWVCAAGNTIEDGAISNEMGTALADRFMHVYVTATAKAWIEWASANEIHPSVLTFIKLRPDELETNARALENRDLITPTPRSWHRVSNVLKQDMPKELSPKIKRQILETEVNGYLGNIVSQDFFHVLEEVDGLPDIAELLKATPKQQLTMVPDTIAALHGLTYSTVGYASEIKQFQQVIALFENLTKLEGAKTPRAEIQTLALEMLLAKTRRLGLMRDVMKLKEFAPYLKKIVESV